MKPNTNWTDAGAPAPVGPARVPGRGMRRAAIILCLLPAVYFLFGAGYGLLHAGDFASDLPRLLRYVLGPLAIAAGLIWAARLRNAETALMVGIVATSVLTALFMFEAYLTLRLLPQQMGVVGVLDGDVSQDAYRGNIPPAYTLKRLNIVMGVRQLDQAVLSAVPDRQVLLCSHDGQPITYQADRFGFRNPPGAYDAPTDIMILGNSFAEGLCLPDGEGLAGQLRGSYPALVNTGSRGAGPAFELAVLGRFGPALRPKLTLFTFFEGNDWENLEREMKTPWLGQVFDLATNFGAPGWTPAQLDATAPIIDGWWDGDATTLRDYLQRRSLLRNFFALHNTATVLGLHYPKAMEPNPDYQAVLERAAQIVSGWGGKIAVVYIPSHDRYGGVLPHQFVQEPLRDMVHQAADRAGVQVIDLTNTLNQQPHPRQLYAPDSHFNADGAALAADAIRMHVQELGLLAD